MPQESSYVFSLPLTFMRIHSERGGMCHWSSVRMSSRTATPSSLSQMLDA